MAIRRMDHIGVVVDDLAGAIEFFVTLGLEIVGEGEVGGDWVDRIVGLEGARSRIAMLEVPGGGTRLELTQFATPASPAGDAQAPANAPGLRHVAFEVDDLDAAVATVRERGAALVGEIESLPGAYRLCYVRGPQGIIVELAERIG